MTIGNLPGYNKEVECKVTENGGFLVAANGWRIFEIDAATPEGQAQQIANLVMQARDAGFRMGQAHIRQALGLVK